MESHSASTAKKLRETREALEEARAVSRNDQLPLGGWLPRTAVLNICRILLKKYDGYTRPEKYGYSAAEGNGRAACGSERYFLTASPGFFFGCTSSG